MRKLIFQMMVSLDGYFEGPQQELDWHHVDEEFNEYARDLLNSVDLLVFGRVTYQLMAGYWATPAAANDEPAIAAKMNALPKLVFSHRLQKVEWNNTGLRHDNPVNEVSRLKHQPGKDIAIFGSSRLAVSLAEAGLIDEYRILINPLFLGRGNTVLHGLQQRLPLKLASVRRFNSGLVLLCYRQDDR